MRATLSSGTIAGVGGRRLRFDGPFGRGLGVAFLIFGVAGSVALVSIDWRTTSVYPIVVLASPLMVCSGLVFIARPGARISSSEVEVREDGIRRWWSGSTTADKLIWGVAGLVGVGLSVAADHVFGVSGML